MTKPDNSTMKKIQHDQWAAAADGWRRRDALLKKGAAPVTERMLEIARIVEGGHVLDIASGTGEPAISAAKLVGTSGKVIGIDLADEMLAVAREKVGQEGVSNIEFQCIDAEGLDVAAGSVDAVTMRWGLMFMPDPQACLVPARRALKEGGRISIACWAEPAKNPFVSILMQVLGNYMEVPTPPPGTPGIFALADRGLLYRTIEQAGFSNIVIEELAFDVLEVADGKAYWEAISDLAAPVMALVSQLPEEARTAYIAQVIETANSLKQGNSLKMRGTTWIVGADK